MASKEQQAILLGNGITFPIELDSTGKPPIETGTELIRSSIRIILAYTWGERFFLRNFGANTDNLLEEPNIDLLEDILEYQIKTSIHKFEKRVKNLTVSIESNHDIKIEVRITYEIIQTQYHDSFIYPFYKDIKY